MKGEQKCDEVVWARGVQGGQGTLSFMGHLAGVMMISLKSTMKFQSSSQIPSLALV